MTDGAGAGEGLHRMIDRGAHGARRRRLLTVPNLITLVRLVCIPLFLYLLFGLDERAAAAILLGLLGATDWIDGQIARRFDQVSEFGKMFDPTVDRLLLLTAVTAIMLDGAVPLWFGLLTLVREILISSWMVLLTLLGAKRIDVTWWGKAGTFGLMFAYPMFLFSADPSISEALHDVVRGGAFLFGVPGLALAYVAGAYYVPIGLRALREGRSSPDGPDWS